mmetsp:Transcript_36658/g.68219  ORF Transcript_36658/g.68219 Transcript_36658/m.68219 type:complete len:254 (-) Transcript_36658:312-1073(-)
MEWGPCKRSRLKARFPLENLGRALESYHLGLLVAQSLQILLAGKFNHRRRATHQHDRVSCRGRQALFDHVGRDEPLLVLPVGWRKVQCVVQLEATFAISGQIIQHLTTQDVILCLVGINQIKGAGIASIPKGGLHDLKHRSETCAASHHAHVLDGDGLARQLKGSAAKVLIDSKGACDFEPIARFFAVEVEPHLPSIIPGYLLSIWHSHLPRAIDLHNEIHISRSFISSDWCILPVDLLLALVRIRLAVPGSR